MDITLKQIAAAAWDTTIAATGRPQSVVLDFTLLDNHKIRVSGVELREGFSVNTGRDPALTPR